MSKPNLTAAQWRELEEIVSRFEAALHDRKHPRVRDFLPAGESASEELLIELIAAEAEHDWRQGQETTTAKIVADYSDSFTTESGRAALVTALNDVRSTIMGQVTAVTGSSPKQEHSLPKAQTLGRYQMIEPINRNPMPRGKSSQ